jgi:hypothetical protein
MGYQTANRIEELPTSVNYSTVRFGDKKIKSLASENTTEDL